MGIDRRIGNKEREYVLEVLNGDFRNSNSYLMTKHLETAFAERFGTRYAIALCNGTATLHTALEAAGVGPGDEVIVPPLTMASTSFAVLHANATPVFADIDPETFEISASSIESRITPKTKAIITVALYGLSPDMDPIMEIAQKNNLVVIEDDAQCFLGRYKGRMVGTIGHMASFSFQSSKHMTSGEGGMIITDNEELATKVRRFSCLGYAGVSTGKGKITKNDIQDPEYNRHLTLGWNYRMSDLCGAVCLGQLERLDMLVNARREVARKYDDVIRDTSWLIPQKFGPEYDHAYWTYVVRLADDRIPWYAFRDQYQRFGGDGIYAAWRLTYQEPAFTQRLLLGREQFLNNPRFEDGLCPVAESYQPRLLQFKTNYWNPKDAVSQMEALKKTIDYFDGLYR